MQFSPPSRSHIFAATVHEPRPLSMTDAKYFRGLAAQCRRAATGSREPEMVTELTEIADALIARADELDLQAAQLTRDPEMLSELNVIVNALSAVADEVDQDSAAATK
jgi:hypothetical protein